MLKVKETKQFKKNLILAKKRGENINILLQIINILINEEPLPQKYKDHPLKGKLKGKRDCHITSDFILIYKISKPYLILDTVGTHVDLF
ncbi:MAG: type II toxin-antitoxin system YafQ family toxin [Elusimicrobiota bacterium]|jgi:mRNA interferase YafQ|nr:type II toxin-antitoxin system YafQ family toxin [Elusimicrobiota bacterium]